VKLSTIVHAAKWCVVLLRTLKFSSYSMAAGLAAQDCKLSAIAVPGDVNDSLTAKKHEKGGTLDGQR
jgi:hypothetical protein